MLFSLLVSLFALIVAGYLAKDVLRRESGTVEMQRVADAIREGAEAFLRRQYRTIGFTTIGLATWHMLGNLWFFVAGFTGILTSLLFVYITQY
jgi:K(+)-stimulated pyrophosphate-energized sodium pump